MTTEEKADALLLLTVECGKLIAERDAAVQRAELAEQASKDAYSVLLIGPDVAAHMRALEDVLREILEVERATIINPKPCSDPNCGSCLCIVLRKAAALLPEKTE